MTRRLSLPIFALALLLASEPLLHQHPLSGRTDGVASNASTCVVCAAGVNRLPDVPAAVIAPQVVAYSIFSRIVTAVRTGTATALPSRAPPVA